MTPDYIKLTSSTAHLPPTKKKQKIHVCVCVCGLYLQCSQGHKGASDLKFGGFELLGVVAGNWTQVLCNSFTAESLLQIHSSRSLAEPGAPGLGRLDREPPDFLHVC